MKQPVITREQPIISRTIDVQDLLHPSEESRFILAVAVGVLAIIALIALTWQSQGIVLLVVGFIFGNVWVVLEIAKAHFIGHNVKVSSNNFPAIYEILDEVKRLLNYTGRVDVYIIEEGSVNALLAKFFRTQFIVLHSGMVENIDSSDGRKQIEFIIGRFVGALKSKHSRIDLISIIINSFEQIVIFNVFLLPYERAVQYSGDQIGLAVCQDLENAVRAFTRMMVGNKLFSDVNPSAILAQGQEVNNFWGVLARLMSSHPHIVHRYTNLLAFARKKYPVLYDYYLSTQAPTLKPQLEYALQSVVAHQ
jgi:Zn-dependent protease with chaperone function